MMIAAVKGRAKEEAETMFDEFHCLVKGEQSLKTEEHCQGRQVTQARPDITSSTFMEDQTCKHFNVNPHRGVTA